MKRKGITIWEQYIERIVLGVALLFFLGVIGWQIVSDPNTVNEGGRTISPGEIDELVQARARDLNARYETSARSPVEIPEYRPVLDDYRAMLAAPISHTDRIAAIQREIRFTDLDVAPTELAMYYVPVPPAPQVLRPRQFFDAIEPELTDRLPELGNHFPGTTHDGTWVVPAAALDLDAVRREYASSTDELAQLPGNFYENRLDVLHVKLERMRLVDGQTWSDLTTLDVPPGMLTFEPRLRGEVSKGVRDEVLGELRRTGAQLEIVRPPFYPTRAGAFMPPTADASEDELQPVTEADREVRRTRARLQDLLGRRAQLEEQIRGLGGDPSRPPAGGGTPPPGRPTGPTGPTGPGGGDGGGRRGTPGGGGMGSPGGGGEGLGSPAGGDGAGPGRGGSDDAARRTARIDTLRAELDRLVTRVERERARLESLTGREVDTVSDQDIVPVDPMSADRLVIWSHDLDVRAGETYRYRFTVHYYNPFFARRLDLLPDQHELADAIVLASQSSDWSEPVTVDLPQRVFVVEANPNAGESGFGEAVAEVYRFYDGRWWFESFRVEPGMQIGGMRRIRASGTRQADADVDFGTEWFLLDVVPDLDADREAVERGRGAIAVLQRISGSGRLVLDPRRMADDTFREWLQWRVEDADRDPGLALR